MITEGVEDGLEMAEKVSNNALQQTIRIIFKTVIAFTLLAIAVAVWYLGSYLATTVHQDLYIPITLLATLIAIATIMFIKHW